jgi:lysophospholipase L1-like esterase
MKKDYRSKSVKKIVVIGESNAFGMCASDPRNEWVQTVANLIRDFQDEPLMVLNNAIPANVIGPTSPGYRYLPECGKPSALERYDEDLIKHNPDLAIIAFGLNDSRCGTPQEAFLRDLETIMEECVNKTDALVVIASPYWNTQYSEELWNSLPQKPEWATGEYLAFAKTGRNLVWSYVTGMKKLATKYGCLFVDLFSNTENCTWLLHDDQCHYNDVGQRVLGQIMFTAIACNCSFCGKKSMRIAREGEFDVPNTGGTQGMSRMIYEWLGR